MIDATDPNAAIADVIAIVGVGLLGGSLAAAVKARKPASRIIGAGRNPARLQAAQQAGLIDAFTADVGEAARGADVVFVCTPVDRIVDSVRQAASTCRSGTLLSDVGSVKENICRELANGLPCGVTFIGSHPLAGSEKQGFEHADAELFDGCVCVVTPDANSPAEALLRLRIFWQALGASVIEMSAADHDRAVATTSHVPHIVAAALAATLSEQLRPLAATGFADTTRIAAGDPELWVSILLGNEAAVVDGLAVFTEQLTALRDAVSRHDVAALKTLLQLAKTNRQSLDEAKKFPTNCKETTNRAEDSSSP